MPKKQPEITIDDLSPRSSIGGYWARWTEEGVQAVAALEPIKDQPAHGFILECWAQSLTNRSAMGRKQQETGDRLIPLVKAYMIEAMRAAEWTERGQDPTGRTIWQHASRSTPRDTLPAPTRESGLAKAKRTLDQDIADHQREKQQKQVPVTTEQNKILSVSTKGKTYTRRLALKQVTGTCKNCQTPFTRWVYPGPTPRYCDACTKDVEKARTRARVANFRARKQTES